jgi:adenylate kinase
VLLSDDLLLEVVKSKLSEIPTEKGVIFDGIPRRLGQAQFLLDALKKQGRNDFITLFVNISKEETFNRLLLRASTEGRADDTKEKIEFRLKQYEQDTLPVLEFLKANTTFFEIDGMRYIEEVTTTINNTLGI